MVSTSLVVFQNDLHGQYLIQGKKSSFWKTSFVSKKKVVPIYLHSHRIAWNKYYSVINKQMNFNCPMIETSESIEPNENNLELDAITNTFSKIFQYPALW